MDAFFAAVEQRDRPNLKGKPVVVGSDPKQGKGRGVVSTCSYEARRFGIHSAMPISIAYKRCPYAVFLPVNMKKYAAVSEKMFCILYDFTPDVEVVSIDEAFLDITDTYHFYKTPHTTCKKIKERVYDELSLTASIGIAPIKMVAKIASDHCKPDGLLEITKRNMLDFLWPLAIEKLWGIGLKTKTALNAMGITTIGELARFSASELRSRFGITGQHIFDLANGIDERMVEPCDDIKSISNEYTFESDTDERDEIYDTLLVLSQKVSRRLRKAQLKGKTLTVKIRIEGFKTYTRAHTFLEKTNFADTIYRKAKELFDDFFSSTMKIRLVGVRISNFTDKYVHESLFEDKNNEKKENIHRAMDSIKDKFGEDAIKHGLRKGID